MQPYLLNKGITFQRSNLLLALLWLIALFVISPFGEFPINDDWSYTKNVRNLVLEHQFILDTFPAMNLISQTLYGSFFVWCFGFSFVVLRMSILFLSVLASFALKKIIQNLNNGSQWFSLFFVLVVFFNPMMLELSFTFMTDMFFVSMVIFAIYFLLKYKQNERFIHYIFFILFCIMSVLCRQHGLLISILSLSLVSLNKKKITRLILVGLPPLLTWLAHDKYRHYLTEYSIPHGIKYSNDLFKYLGNSPVSNHLNHAGDSIIVAGLILLPLVIIVVIPNIIDNKRKLVYLIPFMLFVGYLVYYVWELYPLGNITSVLECGPKLLKTEINERPKGGLELIRKVQMLVGGISFSLVLFMAFFRKSGFSNIHKRLPLLFIAIALILFAFVWVSDAYFDRYSIPCILLLSLLLIPAKSFMFNKKLGTIAIFLGVLLYCISVFEVRDFFKWQEVRWRALNELNERGITPGQIDGGFEYNGWNKPIEDYSEKGKSWWWVKDDEYIVSTQQLRNYKIENIYISNRVIPPSYDTIFVLKRIENK